MPSDFDKEMLLRIMALDIVRQLPLQRADAQWVLAEAKRVHENYVLADRSDFFAGLRVASAIRD
jgi:hypothetical protein